MVESKIAPSIEGFWGFCGSKLIKSLFVKINFKAETILFISSLVGREEEIVIYSNVLTCALIVLLSFLASVGIAGGVYVMRNMVWTEGVFVGADFWIGVKKNYKTVMLSTLAFTLFLSLTIFSINLS